MLNYKSIIFFEIQLKCKNIQYKNFSATTQVYIDSYPNTYLLLSFSDANSCLNWARFGHKIVDTCIGQLDKYLINIWSEACSSLKGILINLVFLINSKGFLINLKGFLFATWYRVWRDSQVRLFYFLTEVSIWQPSKE